MRKPGPRGRRERPGLEQPRGRRDPWLGGGGEEAEGEEEAGAEDVAEGHGSEGGAGQGDDKDEEPLSPYVATETLLSTNGNTYSPGCVLVH